VHYISYLFAIKEKRPKTDYRINTVSDRFHPYPQDCKRRACEIQCGSGHTAAEPTTPQRPQTHQWFALRRSERSQAHAVVVEKRDDRFGSNRESRPVGTQLQFSFYLKKGTKYHMLPLDLEWTSTMQFVVANWPWPMHDPHCWPPGFAAQRCSTYPFKDCADGLEPHL
jgi:hypothetical protein